MTLPFFSVVQIEFRHEVYISTFLLIKRSSNIPHDQAANRMIKKLQMLPSENDDGNQNIDEDDLAQVG